MKVGVIGSGAMGSRIAKNFIDASHKVYVFNRTKEKAAELIRSGANWSDSPTALAEASDIVFTVLTDDHASESIWLDPTLGLVLGLDSSKVAVECSTISYDWSLRPASKLKEYRYLEAPLVGSRPQAESKQLAMLIAGDEKDYEAVKPLLLDTAAKTPFIGSHGKAIALKLVINSLFGIQVAAFAELYTALTHSGFEEEQIMKRLPNLPVTSPMMQFTLNQFAERQFSPLFPIELIEKDFGYAQQFVKSAGVSANLTSETKSVFHSAIKAGLGDQNISALLHHYQKGAQND